MDVFLGNISASLKLAKGLDYKFLYAINHGAGTRNTNIDGWLDAAQGVSGAGFGAINKANLTSQTFTHTLNYHKDLSENLVFDAVAGYEYWKTNYSNSGISASQFNINLDQASRIPLRYTDIFQNAGAASPYRTFADPTVEIQSYFARVNFNLQDKYFLTATFRADGSNKFGKNNKYGYFPSVGAKWLISNEEFLKNSTVLSNLGLRASWGITGNQEFPAGAALEQVTSSSYLSFSQTNTANPNLKWEKTTSVDVGLDYGFLNNRLTGSIDFYHKNTTDLLIQSFAIAPAPPAAAYLNYPANLINTGVEFSIGAAVIEKKDFSWDLGFNIAYNHNILKNFNSAPIPTAQVSGQGVSGTLAQVFTNNEPLNEYYLKKFSGYDQSGQQIIADNPTFVGNPNPSVILGFSNTLRFKRLSFLMNFGGAFDYLIYNNTHNTITNISNIQKGQNIDASSINSDEAISSGVVASSRYLESGNFLKLRNVSFSYDFGNIGNYFKNCSAYISATNLFVITKFTGFDPEVNVDKNENSYPSRNMEYIPYPTPRIITVGINFGF